MMRWVLLTIAMFWALPALAQSVDISKLTPKQFEQLSPEQRGSLPVLAVVEKIGYVGLPPDRLARGFKVSEIELALMQIGIHLFPMAAEESRALNQSIRRFQKVIGKPETGVLSFSELEELQRRAAFFEGPKVNLQSDGLRVSVLPDTAEANGIWYDPLAKGPQPLLRVAILCQQSSMACAVSTATFSRATGMAAADFDLAATIWRVETWQNDRVIATHELLCQTSRIEVFGGATTLSVSPTNGAGCSAVVPRGALLVDGRELTQRFTAAFGFGRLAAFDPDFLRGAYHKLGLPMP